MNSQGFSFFITTSMLRMRVLELPSRKTLNGVKGMRNSSPGYREKISSSKKN
jgi:hypothetical protein